MITIKISLGVVNDRDSDKLRDLYNQGVNSSDDKSIQKTGVTYTYSVVRDRPFSFEITINHPASAKDGSQICNLIEQRVRLLVAKQGFWKKDYTLSTVIQ
jgi:hypothetical protein